MNYQHKNNRLGRNKATAFILAITLTFSLAMASFLQPMPSYADAASDQATASDSLSKAVAYFSSSSGRNQQLAHWEELLAVYAASLLPGTTFASIQLENWDLPASPAPDLSSQKSFSSYLFSELIKGYAPASQVHDLIINATSGAIFSSDPIDQAMAMLTLEVASSAGISVDGYQPIAAATYLASLQKSDGGYQSVWDPRSNVDTTGYVALAFAPFATLNSFNVPIKKIISYFQTEQMSNGGFPYYWSFGSSSGQYESANSTSLAVWGLSALKAHTADSTLQTSIAAIASRALPALTKYQNADGSFGFSETGSGTFDSSTSRQVMVALYDLASDGSLYDHIMKHPTPMRTVSLQVETTSGAIITASFVTATSSSITVTAIDSINRALNLAGKQEAQISGTTILSVDGLSADAGQTWRVYVNGIEKNLNDAVNDHDQVTLYLAPQMDRIYQAVFDQDIINATMGENFTLKLTGKQLGIPGAENTSMEGATILVNGSPYGGYPYITASNGSITLQFLSAGTYEISAQLYGTVTEGGVCTKTAITHPVSKVVIASGQGYSKTVSIRVEGISQSGVLSTPSALQRDFVASTSSSKLLTAEDAVKQMLDSNNISYDIFNGYISRIGGLSNAPYPAWYPSWMYIVNGISPSVGIGNFVLQGNEEILVYYAGGTTVYPIVEEGKESDGSLTLAIYADVMDWNTWTSVKTPVTGVGIIWDGTPKGVTGDDGTLTISSGSATVGYHSLQLDKHDDDGTALVIPLASDHLIKIAEETTLTAAQQASNLSSKSTGNPQNIQYTSVVASPRIIVSTGPGVQLPEIIATNVSNSFTMTIPQGTIVSSSAQNWDGTIHLPVPVTVNMPGKNIQTALAVGSEGNNINFDRPVRILLPGAAGKTIAYLDQSGDPVTIDTQISSDNSTSAATSLDAAGKKEGRITIGNDVAVWTRHFTTFVAYSTASGGSQVNNQITISVTGHQGQSMLASQSMNYTSGMTALSALQATGLDVTIKVSAGYVSAINGLSEFDYGVESGWKYSVNGTYPSVGAGSYSLSAGDVLRWTYVTKINEGQTLTDLTSQGDSLTSIKADTDTVGNVKATVTTKELQDAVAANGGMEITSDAGSIRFDAATLKTIQGKASGDLTITMNKADTSKLSEANKLLIGSRPAYEFTVKSGSTVISQFNGKVTVSMAYKPTAGEDSNAILIYFLNSNGKLELVKNCVYNEKTGTIQFATDHFSTYAVGYHKVNFEDTKTHWAKDSISFLAARGIIKGMTETSFVPEKKVTRAEFVTILANKAGVDLAAYQSTGKGFADVKSSDWFNKAVAWASDQGVVTGSQNSDGSMKFDPNANITRQDMAVILSRYLSKVEKSTLAAPNAAVNFADQSMIADYASFAVKSMQQAGILNGKTASTFAPVDPATRAEAGKMIAEMIKVTF